MVLHICDSINIFVVLCALTATNLQIIQYEVDQQLTISSSCSYSMFINGAKEVTFSPLSICLFVCLFVCEKDYAKSTGWITSKLVEGSKY